MAKNNNQKQVEDVVLQTAKRIDEVVGITDKNKDYFIDKWADRKAQALIKSREDIGFNAYTLLENLRAAEANLRRQAVNTMLQIPEDPNADPIKDAIEVRIQNKEKAAELQKVRQKIDTLNNHLNDAVYKNNDAVWNNLEKYCNQIKDT